jgi:hypothetical protein
MADHNQLFVEQRDQGDFAVRKGNSDRASAVEPTQKKAIEKARELNPGKAPLVERVRNTKKVGAISGANHNRECNGIDD